MIEIHGLSKTFDDFYAVNNITANTLKELNLFFFFYAFGYCYIFKLLCHSYYRTDNCSATIYYR